MRLGRGQISASMFQIKMPVGTMNGVILFMLILVAQNHVHDMYGGSDNLSEISGFHSSRYEGDSVLEYCTI